MFPDKETLNELEEMWANEPTYWKVGCTRCWFSEKCLLMEEAKLRGQMHERCHEDDDTDHKTEIVEMVFGGEVPDELGFGDGGYSEE